MAEPMMAPVANPITAPAATAPASPACAGGADNVAATARAATVVDNVTDFSIGHLPRSDVSKLAANCGCFASKYGCQFVNATALQP
jgi:hypothetical protein